jgi:hypothetical protein
MVVLNLIFGLQDLILKNLQEVPGFKYTFMQSANTLLVVINLSEKVLLSYLLCKLYSLTKKAKENANTCQFVL